MKAKAPDKIYCGNNGHGNLSYSTEKIYPSMEEFVRKEALLKWAKENITTEGATEGFVGGYDKALKDLIKKLQSL